MKQIAKWVHAKYPNAKRREFAKKNKEVSRLFASGAFYSQFTVDEEGCVWGYICPDCQGNRGAERDQWDQLTEVGELKAQQSLDRPCLCEEDCEA